MAVVQANGITHILVIKILLKYFASACAKYIFHIHLAYFSAVIMIPNLTNKLFLKVSQKNLTFGRE